MNKKSQQTFEKIGCLYGMVSGVMDNIFACRANILEFKSITIHEKNFLLKYTDIWGIRYLGKYVRFMTVN